MMKMMASIISGSVATGDEVNITKFVVIGAICVVLVVGVTILGKFASKSDEQESDKEEKTEEK